MKVSLLDIQSGKCVASATNPKTEAPITAVRKGWAEQSPEMWWIFIQQGIAEIAAKGFSMYEVGCIGITYQMHGLVAVDAKGKPVRDAIIWCDSRAVELGSRVRWIHLASHCFSCGQTRPQTAGNELLALITLYAPCTSPASICLMKDGMSMLTGQPCTQPGFGQSRQRLDSRSAISGVRPWFTSS